MSYAFPGLRKRYASFLAGVESADLQDLLNHLQAIHQELRDPESDHSDTPRWSAVEDFLDTVPIGCNAFFHLCEEIEILESLIKVHGDQQLK